MKKGFFDQKTGVIQDEYYFKTPGRCYATILFMQNNGIKNGLNGSDRRRVLVLMNRKSGINRSFASLLNALDKFWDVPGVDLSYQFSQSAQDGREKAERAVEQGVNILLVAGGDGTVSTVGAALVKTDTVLGVIPMGSGNGFARHFDIPLSPGKAIQALAKGRVTEIDVGIVNNRPFLVTCSMAWDAAIVRSFEKSPVRGIIPYIFAGVYEFFDYDPQEIRVTLDSGKKYVFPNPLVFTVANLTQFGGGAVITPYAKPDDGLLELITAQKQHVPVFLANLHKLLSRSISEIPEVVLDTFKSMTVSRPHAAQIQVDGELVNVPAEVEVKVLHKALKVLVP